MYGLPKDVDLRFLHGATLEDVAVDSASFILRFDRNVAISLDCETRLTRDSICQSFPQPRGSEGDVKQLLGERVVEAEGTPDGTLTLLFSNQAVLELFDSGAPDRESYRIQHGETWLAV